MASGVAYVQFHKFHGRRWRVLRTCDRVTSVVTFASETSKEFVPRALVIAVLGACRVGLQNGPCVPIWNRAFQDML